MCLCESSVSHILLEAFQEKEEKPHLVTYTCSAWESNPNTVAVVNALLSTFISVTHMGVLNFSAFMSYLVKKKQEIVQLVFIVKGGNLEETY